MSQMLYARDAYAEALIELGKKNKNIVVLDADLASSTRTGRFAEKFPERFFNCGVAEQNMMGTAAGLASCGKISFASTFAVFGSGRAWDQLRNTVCYNKLNVKVVVTHAGVTVGPDGSSHQAIGDIGLMRSIPNMTIIVPCDAPEAKEAVLAAAEYQGPVYIRLGRTKVCTVENRNGFKIGKSQLLREGKDVAILACGILVQKSIEAAKGLAQEGISARVVNMHTIRPLDKKMIIESAKATGHIVSCEEHLVSGGLGSAIAEVLAENIPTPMNMIGIRGKFGQSGTPDELIKKYHLDVEDIIEASKKLISS